MFEKLAKFRPFEPRRLAPRTIPATHSNDNLPGFRHPEGRRPRPKSALACHWDLIDGRPECRWTVEAVAEPATADPDRHPIAARLAAPQPTTVRPAASKMLARA